ncbi:MAG TPA: tetratricopeptide repeat protein [Nitrospiria bacterium]|nr:tetratricopeptide repeat protein [Nitrospiria bacterium]
MNDYSANIREALGLAIKYHQSGRLEEAESIYQQVLKISPNNIDALHLLGILAYGLKEYEAAVELINKAVQLNPGYAEAHYNLGKVYQEQGSLDEAIASYQRAVAVNPGYAEAHNNLGNAFLGQGRLDDAVASYGRAIAANPDDAYSYCNLGNALREQGRLDDAIASYRHAITLNPGYSKARNSLGYTLQEQGKLEEAIVTYRYALEKDPDNSIAAHMLAALAGQTTETAPPIYVRTLFDYCAKRFEDQLVKKLEYRSPTLLRQALDSLLNEGQRFQNAIDLGCGTGLSGMAFRPIVNHLSGIDISPNMIEEAGRKGIYDSLQVGDIHDFLRETDEKYDLFIATDVLVYIGNLLPIFSSVRDSSLGGAYFVFLTESIDSSSSPQGKDYLLRQTGRYAHSLSYIKSLAREYNFEITICQQAVIRRHNEEGIIGDHLVLRYLK